MTALRFFSAVVVVCFLGIARVLAAAALVPRAVSPTIISPSSQDQWPLGAVETVTWITDGLNVTGVNGTILMGYVQSNGSTFLWKDQPLAQDFPLSDGQVNVRCPLNLPTGARYVIALLGDENNLSAVFQVIDANNPIPSSVQPEPSTLSTTGHVPSATITQTSVVGTIPPPSNTASSTGTDGTSSASTSSDTTHPTQTKPSNNGAEGWKEGSRSYVAFVSFQVLLLVAGLRLV
ncbi:hypothetical protein GY45DRAFT_1325702 [Cubamyces sp. BRFM 1775]|nr:hypothetical protein GY45DRAFT_1325702 [Cubamyces sp. BRFM 1775]